MKNTPFLSEVMPDHPCPIPARSIGQKQGGVKAREPARADFNVFVKQDTIKMKKAYTATGRLRVLRPSPHCENDKKMH
jgi:hypothetical protein